MCPTIAAKAAPSPIDLEKVASILRSAIFLAKSQQISKLRTLREKLRELYPDNPREITEALHTWATQATTKGQQ